MGLTTGFNPVILHMEARKQSGGILDQIDKHGVTYQWIATGLLTAATSGAGAAILYAASVVVDLQTSVAILSEKVPTLQQSLLASSKELRAINASLASHEYEIRQLREKLSQHGDK